MLADLGNNQQNPTTTTNYPEAIKEEFAKSLICDEILATNFKYRSGDSGLDRFLSECDLSKDDRINSGRVSSSILKKYDHLRYGFWGVNSLCPLSGETFLAQVKPVKPRHYRKDGKEKAIKYETPKGMGTPFIYLDIPFWVIEQLAIKHGIKTLPNNFCWDKWRWVRDNPLIPITITEGAKKAAALLSQGIIAVASFSCTTHSESATEDEAALFRPLKPELRWLLDQRGIKYELTDEEKKIILKVKAKRSRKKEDLMAFGEVLKLYNGGAVSVQLVKNKQGTNIEDCYLIPQKRNVYIAFDRDKKPSAEKTVLKQIKSFGRKLNKNGVEVYILEWEQEEGKGIDDFIARYYSIYSINSENTYDSEALNRLYSKAITYQKFANKLRALATRKLSDAIKVSMEFFATDLIKYAVTSHVKMICVKSQQKTGKTTAISTFIKEEIKKGKNVLNITHRQTLSRNLGDRLGIGCYLDEEFKKISKMLNITEDYSVSICADSLLKISPDNYYDYIILDEVEQIVWHLLSANTEIKNHRGDIIHHLFTLIKNCINNGGTLILADADLSNYSVNFFRRKLDFLTKEDITILENTYKPFTNRKLHIYGDIFALRQAINEAIKKGERVAISCGGQKVTSTSGSINMEVWIANFLEKSLEPEEIFRIDQTTIQDPDKKECGITDHLHRLKQAKAIIFTNTISTGVSMDEEIVGKIDKVFGIFYGNYAVDDFEQSLERYRGDADRHVFIAGKGCVKIGKNDSSYREMEKHFNRKLTLSEMAITPENMDRFYFDRDLVTDFSIFASRIVGDSQHLRENFIIHAEEKGYQIEYVGKASKKVKTQLSLETKKVKAITCNEEANAIRKVDRLSKTELREIENKKRKTRKEQLQEKREKLHRKYGEDFLNYLDGLKFTQFWVNELYGYQFSSLHLRFLAELGFEFLRNVDTLRAKNRAKFNEKNKKTDYFLNIGNLATNSSKVCLLETIGIKVNELEKQANIDFDLFARFLTAKDLNNDNSPQYLKAQDELLNSGYLVSNSDLRLWSKKLDDLDQATKTYINTAFDIDLAKTEGMEDKHTVRYGMFLRRLGYGLQLVVKATDKSDPEAMPQNYYRIIDSILDDRKLEWSIEIHRSQIKEEVFGCPEKLKEYQEEAEAENISLDEIIEEEALQSLKMQMYYDGDLQTIAEINTISEGCDYTPSILDITKRGLRMSQEEAKSFSQYLGDYWYSNLMTEINNLESEEEMAAAA